MVQPGETKYTKAVYDFCQQISEKDFIETFFSIINKERQEIPLKFNVVQQSIYEKMRKKNVILKYRKPGVSVFVQNLFLARILQRKNRNCVVLSYDKESTARMLERTEWTLKHFPIKITLESDNKNEFKIKETNSKIFIGVAGSKAFGRGDDITDLHISELAWWEDTSVMTGLMEALTTDHQVFIESTANGPTNLYAQLCRKARLSAPGTEWMFHFFPWWIDPTLEIEPPEDFVHTEEEKELKAKFNLNDRKIMWRRVKINDMLEPDLFPQEFPATIDEAFLILGDCVFNSRAMAVYKNNARTTDHVGYLVNVDGQRKFNPHSTGNLRIWKFPEPGQSYMLVADPSDPSNKESMEKKGDPACVQVIKVGTLEQVACWHGFVEPYELGRVSADLGYFYNGALAVIERNPYGIGVIDALRSFDYPAIFKMMNFEGESAEDTDKLGWITNIITRPLLIASLQEAITSGLFIIPDPETVAELSTFVRHKRTGKIAAANGCHDDRVIPLGIAAYLRSVNMVPMLGDSGQSYMEKKRQQWASEQVGTGYQPGRGGY